MDTTALKPARVNPVMAHPDEQRLSLDGEWSFRLDPTDQGLAEQWPAHPQNLRERIAVPGCWQGQGFGSDQKDCLWDFCLEARVFRATGKGTGWYGRTFHVPQAWQGRQLWLNFGGAHPTAEVWLNGKRLGENSLPFVPFAFDVTAHIRRDAANDVVVRIHEQHRELGLAFSWQGNWSGLYRGVDLTATGPCWLERCELFADAAANALRLRVKVGSAGEQAAAANLRLAVSAAPVGNSRPAVILEFPLTGLAAEMVLPVPDALRWSPDTPKLYRVDLVLQQHGAVCDARSERTGFVSFEARGKQLCINGEPYYWRGSGDFISCPETGCPDTDRDRWRRKLKALRDYGYNFVRCQSYVYGPEYYEAADEVGLLVQGEMGMLGAWGGQTPWHVYQWPKPTPDKYPSLKQQWDLVVARDVAHPSANIYCMSNECWTHTDFPRIAWQCYRETKARKPSALVIWTDGGYNKDLPGDFINQSSYNFKTEEREALSTPLIEHEFRWWSSYPDIALRKKYTGAVRPYAADMAAKVAARRGQAHLLETYARTSQQLQAVEAKAKMEGWRRDQANLAGICHFNAMDTNPSPQGIIDEFYEQKLLTAATWRQTNGDTVVLSSLGFDNRCWRAGQQVQVKLSVSDFSHPPFQEPKLSWTLQAGQQRLANGEIRIAHVPFRTTPAGEIEISVPKLDRPVVTIFSAQLTDADTARTVCNQWPVWIFPDVATLPGKLAVYGNANGSWIKNWPDLPRTTTIPPAGQSAVLLTDKLDAPILAFMQRGGRVILAADEGLVRPHCPSYFFTPPANYAPYEDGQNGTVIATHPALGDLPHDGFADWQLFRLMENAPPIDLEPLGLAEGDPIIRVIHRYPILHPLAYLVERRVGTGGLIVCSLELKPDWIEAQYLLAQLTRHAASDAFQPAQSLTEAAATQLLAAAEVRANTLP